MTAGLRVEIERVLGGRCELSEAQWAMLEAHYSLLVKWNRKLNLTRISGVREAAEFHYAESLLCGMALPAGLLRVADLGSGAGFPGIPVAVLRPECEVTLIERDRRKAVFLREATRDWANVRVLACGANEVVETFDWVLLRAVRWADVQGIVDRLASHALLLLGEPFGSEAAESLLGEPVVRSDPGREGAFGWKVTCQEQLPIGRSRWVSRVSRETRA
ncbi:MAG: class I SAM-dependent methyltransferase [Bryobacterales bacterium]|nr:class I SAM-dependent methyltransferase [Bryobacterales bacterium]